MIKDFQASFLSPLFSNWLQSLLHQFSHFLWLVSFLFHSGTFLCAFFYLYLCLQGSETPWNGGIVTLYSHFLYHHLFISGPQLSYLIVGTWSTCDQRVATRLLTSTINPESPDAPAFPGLSISCLFTVPLFFTNPQPFTKGVALFSPFYLTNRRLRSTAPF